MATKTIYTAKCSVPIYSGWRCPYCDTVNTSDGEITYQRQTASSSLSIGKQNAAKQRASSLVESEWAYSVLNTILYPKRHAKELLNNMVIYNTKCCKCHKRAKWDKSIINRVIQLVQIILLMPAVICLVLCTLTILGGKYDYWRWVLLGVSFAVLLSKYVFEKQYAKKLSSIPGKYAPVFGSLNSELYSAALQQKNTIPSPAEVIAIINSFVPNEQAETNKSVTISSLNHETDEIITTVVSKNEPKAEETLFCRKCGTRLQNDSDFCHKCGTRVIH